MAEHSTLPTAPLAERIRPTSLQQVVGQQHLLGTPQAPGPIRQWLAAGGRQSLILWGPPGVGKTTLAKILAQELGRPFQQLSAVQAGVKDVRAVLEMARLEPGTLLFIDEIHRFNKAQQDALLHAVEQGLITLIGATTENPSFEVISALLSRSQTYILESLSLEEVQALIQRALADDELLKPLDIHIAEWAALYELSGGDGRKALNLLELVAGTAKPGSTLEVTDKLVLQLAQQNMARYDKAGEQHYDVISAFIKSIRGSDPNAGLYWLARMLHGGEDILFIARRLIILASEDIGNANPNALLLANATFEACSKIGMPEARIILGQCVTYLATSPKSNAAYMGINAALAAAQKTSHLPVPLHLRNAPTKLMKEAGYATGYKYSHDHHGEVDHQEFLPPELRGTAFYQPKAIGKEAELQRFIAKLWGQKYGG